MRYRALILSILCIGCLKCESVGREKPFAPKIAVVGAGIGGASATSFLRQLFSSSEAEIDVYEKERVGGRLSTADVGGNLYEIGASALHPKNKYMVEFMKNLDLKKRHMFGTRLGLLDSGEEYMVMEGDRPINFFGKLFHRYGNSISNWHTVINEVFDKFLKIYHVQNQGFAFSTVEGLLRAAHSSLVNLTSVTTNRFLLDNNLIPIFIKEIATGVIRINYGQNTDINAFAGSMSLMGAKAGLWGVLGGNEQVPQLLIKQANATVIVEKVTAISLTPQGKYKITLESDYIQPKLYDMVIVTVPLIDGVSDIKFVGFPLPIRNFEGHYHKSVTTLVDGIVNTKFLKDKYKEEDMQELLTTVDHALFNSLSRVFPVNLDEEWGVATSTVWKVMSQSELTESELDNIFLQRNETMSKSWLAYPHYSPPEKLGPFVLHTGLFYTSSLEWAASAMELSAIAGKNVALLAYYHWTREKLLVDSYPEQKDEL